jgi:predicted PurR-regulated permease PerM
MAVAAHRLKVAQVIRATLRERQNVIALGRGRHQVVNPAAALAQVVVSCHREFAIGVILAVVPALVRGGAPSRWSRPAGCPESPGASHAPRVASAAVIASETITGSRSRSRGRPSAGDQSETPSDSLSSSEYAACRDTAGCSIGNYHDGRPQATVTTWSYMVDTPRNLTTWVTFAGCVLVIAVLYFAQAVLVPFALAILLTFVLTPPVSWLERWIGRVPAVLTTVTLVFVILGLAGWGLARQTNYLADDLPRYRVNILAKIADVRGAGKGGSVEKLQETIDDIKTDLEGLEAPSKAAPRPVVVSAERVAGFSGFAWLGPIVGPLTTAGLVLVMVIFMLLERRDLRDRLIRLFGHGQLAITTKAFDEAGTRVSRQLLMQSLVNVAYGLVAWIGLHVLGVPYPFVWAALGAALRYIPYLGPVLGAGAPILVSLAALGGWAGPLWVIGLFVLLELFTNLVLETVLYAGAAGVSQVALLVSVAFWTWLWGPLGLLMATPLTVCLVVIGKHVPGLDFVGTLMADTPALAADYSYYQRLLARDQSEAADLIERHIKNEAPNSVYDALLLPALNYAERDRLEDRLSADEETAVIDATRELLSDAAESIRRAGATVPVLPEAADLAGPRASLRVLGYATNGAADELALAMLAHVVADVPIALEITSGRLQASELIALVQAQAVSVVCLADLPPSPPSKTRYLVKRLHAVLPDLRILVGRWGPAGLADESTQRLTDAGATLVALTLADTRTYLGGLVEIPRVPLPEPRDTQAA